MSTTVRLQFRNFSLSRSRGLSPPGFTTFVIKWPGTRVRNSSLFSLLSELWKDRPRSVLCPPARSVRLFATLVRFERAVVASYGWAVVETHAAVGDEQRSRCEGYELVPMSVHRDVPMKAPDMVERCATQFDRDRLQACSGRKPRTSVLPYGDLSVLFGYQMYQEVVASSK